MTKTNKKPQYHTIYYDFFLAINFSPKSLLARATITSASANFGRGFFLAGLFCRCFFVCHLFVINSATMTAYLFLNPMSIQSASRVFFLSNFSNLVYYYSFTELVKFSPMRIWICILGTIMRNRLCGIKCGCCQDCVYFWVLVGLVMSNLCDYAKVRP